MPQRSRTLALLGVLILATGRSLPAQAVRGQPAQKAPTTTDAASWPQFRGGPTLTGVAGSDLPATLKVQWTYDAGDAVQSSAAIAGGVVYVGSTNGRLAAI